MTKPFSQMSRAKRSLETVNNSKALLPSFYNRGSGKRDNIVWCMHGVPTEFLLAFDLEPEWPENFGTLCSARLVAVNFIETAEAEGFAPDLCSYVMNTIGYCRKSVDEGRVPAESPLAEGMGNPIMLLGSSFLCEPRYKWFQTIATRYLQLPVFSSDPVSPPFDADIDDPRIAEHFIAQIRDDLRAQVAFLEKQTGKKLDIDRFRHIMQVSQESLAYWYDTLELRKAAPCPMGPTDYFSCIIPQLYMLGKEEALEFYRKLHDEVKKRVDQGTGGIADEKYRLIFSGIPPWYNLGIFNYLEGMGAVSVFETCYYPGPSVDVDLDDPVEGLAQRIWQKACWYHRGGAEATPELCDPGIMLGVGSRFLRQSVEDYAIDGVLMHRTRSCRAVSWGQIHNRNILEELGIPALIFESDMADPRAWSDSRFKSQIEPFIESVAQNKSDIRA
ncbi:MAG: 2-hydroxyacyl-CoA dehydratase [Deltaproteobacteria bacterium]|nr:2-hydroxyacyl-CoA dehydratase [Deltaproteobacteria bacterium]